MFLIPPRFLGHRLMWYACSFGINLLLLFLFLDPRQTSNWSFRPKKLYYCLMVFKWNNNDMYIEKHIAYDLVTFEQPQMDGWSTDITQPIRSITQVSYLVPILHINVNKIKPPISLKTRTLLRNYFCQYFMIKSITPPDFILL